MKTMMELTKQLTETTSTSKPAKVHEPLNGNKNVVVEKQTAKPQPSEILASGTVTKQKVDSKILKTIGAEVSRGTFVVGGSPVGWNFLLYPGTKLVYYGRTKESVLASRASK